jgi:hypothetical protein
VSKLPFHLELELVLKTVVVTFCAPESSDAFYYSLELGFACSRSKFFLFL